MANELKRFVTPAFRVSYPHLAEPSSGTAGGVLKYGITGVFDGGLIDKAAKDYPADLLPPGSVTWAEIASEVNRLVGEKWGLDKARWPEGLRYPFRNGSRFNAGSGGKYPQYEGMTFFSARTAANPKFPAPGIADRNGQSIVKGITDPEMAKRKILDTILPGYWARCQLAVSRFDKDGGKGVCFFLNSVQFLKADEVWQEGAGGSVEGVFSALPDLPAAPISDAASFFE